MFPSAVLASESATRFSAESLGKLFAIVLALAVGEAMKQFVAEKKSSENTSDKPRIHWNRLPALLAFIVLIVPFSHGMGRYFFETYEKVVKPTQYSLFLLLDTAAFVIEAALFFIMSRRLDPEDRNDFYGAVIALLCFDIVWGSISASTHSPELWSWVLVNFIALPIFISAWFCIQRKQPLTIAIVLAVLVVLRSVADYYCSWAFYFPPLNP